MNPRYSQQVSWWSVHTFVERLCNALHNPWPMVGTPAWCQLDDHNPAKWAAVLDAAQHWALRLETCQAARAEASRDISAAADWSAIATETVQPNGVYIPRRAVTA